jgi:hypothetical protein
MGSGDEQASRAHPAIARNQSGLSPLQDPKRLFLDSAIGAHIGHHSGANPRGYLGVYSVTCRLTRHARCKRTPPRTNVIPAVIPPPRTAKPIAINGMPIAQAPSSPPDVQSELSVRFRTPTPTPTTVPPKAPSTAKRIVRNRTRNVSLTLHSPGMDFIGAAMSPVSCNTAQSSGAEASDVTSISPR